MPISSPPSPPRRTPAARPAAPAPQKTPAQLRAEGIQGWFQLGALGCVTRGWYADAGAIRMHGDKVAVEIANLADGNDAIAKYVDMITGTGPYTALIAAVLPFALQLLANHGRIDPDRAGLAGVVPPRELEQEIRTEIANLRLASQLIAEQRRAEMEAEIALLTAARDTENVPA